MQSVIFFDGLCNLCNRSVQFVLTHDKKAHFNFANLQSNYSKTTLPAIYTQNITEGTFVLLENGEIYTKSTAALRVLKKLGSYWALCYVFIIVPPFFRDTVYQYVAKNRYKWFGKRATCWVPTPNLKARFMD